MAYGGSVRRKGLVAGAVLTVALALGALPGVTGSPTRTPVGPLPVAAFQAIRSAASLDRSSSLTIGPLDAAHRSAGRIDLTTVLIEPGSAAAPAARPRVSQPAAVPIAVRKPLPKPKAVLRGLASWYVNGTTAMRLPFGTHVRICGRGGCINRVVTDWGPARYLRSRIVDLDPADFVRVTGRWLGKGLAVVAVYVY